MNNLLPGKDFFFHPETICSRWANADIVLHNIERLERRWKDVR